MGQKSALDALLSANISDEKDVYIKRLNANFRIKSISGEELQEVTDEASNWVGKGANRRRVTNDDKLGALVIAKACVDPVFANAQLLEKYGAISADEVVLKALRAGEIAHLSQEIMAISGFSFGDDEVEEVKN